jgi:hypothetical protein
MRVKIDWRSSSKDNYKNFCKKHTSIKVTFDEWRNIIYSFNEHFKNYILETGEKAKLPFGFGEFSINKEKGKRIYNFNYHTEGYFFGWMWFRDTARIRNIDLWYFKPTRNTSRLLSHYIKTDDKYQHIYREWKK